MAARGRTRFGRVKLCRESIALCAVAVRWTAILTCASYKKQDPVVQGIHYESTQVDSYICIPCRARSLLSQVYSQVILQ
jgi:hypothetical protein